jgi:hypothetical protein
MNNAQALRDLSRRCRNLAETATSMAVIDQLLQWALELAERADEVEREEFVQCEKDGVQLPVNPRGEPQRKRGLIHPKGDTRTSPALGSAWSTRRIKQE